MDLSKPYDCLPHGLLVSIDKTGLNLIRNYLSNRKQRTKINSSYSDWYDIVRGVPQGSILGPLRRWFKENSMKVNAKKF